MNLILNSQSLMRNNHTTPGDLLPGPQNLVPWHLPSGSHGSMVLKDEKPVCHAPMPSRSALLLCFLILPNSFELKSRAGDTTLVWVWAECTEHEPFSPLQHCSANLLGVIPLRAGQDVHSQELSQLFYHSHILQTDEDFLQCLFHLKFFTKSFYICSACAKILLHVLKIWNSCSCNGISCTLHFPSLIGAVWLWIVLPLTRAKSESVSCQ